jgi:hypothetical protein
MYILLYADDMVSISEFDRDLRDDRSDRLGLRQTISDPGRPADQDIGWLDKPSAGKPDVETCPPLPPRKKSSKLTGSHLLGVISVLRTLLLSIHMLCLITCYSLTMIIVPRLPLESS